MRTKHTPPFSTFTVSAGLMVLLAGSVVGVAQAQESKDRDAKAAAAAKPGVVQPVKRDGGAKTDIARQPAAKSAAQPQPAASPAGEPSPEGVVPAARTDIEFPPPPEGWFRFEAFAEPVDVKLLVDMVADHLKVQIISTETALRDKKIQLYTPVDVPPEKLLDFLGLLLEQNGQMITKDPIGFYVIRAVPEAGSAEVGTELATTQVVPTRGLRPSSLNQAIAQVLKGGPGATGGQNPGQVNMQTAAGNIAYMDDLGVLVMTDTPRRIGAVKSLIETLSGEQINLEFTRFAVKNVSASAAKQRMLELLGQSQRTSGTGFNNAFNPNEQQQQNQLNLAGGLGGTNASNLAARLTPDPQSNALLLRGRPEEVELINRLLAIVDVANTLEPKWYAVGPAAAALAEQGKRSGLGDVTVMSASRGVTGNNNNGGLAGFNGGFMVDEGTPNFFNNRFNSNQSTQVNTGPVFVLDADERGFIYYGTPEQHAQIEKLVKEFGEITQAERVVYEFYKLRFVDAEETADLIRGMINNSVPGGESPLIPGAGGTTGNRRRTRGASENPNIAPLPSTTGTGSEVGAIVATEDVHVLPDTKNNQIVVKAPQRLQPQFARLIEKLDQRRPQVYIDAKIVVVNNREDFRLAVETQLQGISGSGTSALQTLFPGTRTGNTNILNPPTVAPPAATVGGITAAVIRSDYVPLILTAVSQNNAGRLVASPQLLVDDNEEAEISSISSEPTTTTTVGTDGNPSTTSFGGYEDAGPRLKVKPRLSTGDLLSMEYEVELSNFVGSGSGGVPPPKQVQKIKSDSVTLPSDATIVVGGLEFNQNTNTVIKVPLLGDIPIIGEAFKSTQKVDDKRTVYVFITPRIMRDPLGHDLKLNSTGPAKTAGVSNDLPPVKIEFIQIDPSIPKPPPLSPPDPAPDVPARTPVEN